MVWKYLWKSRKRNIPAKNVAESFQSMTENAASVKKKDKLRVVELHDE